MARSHERHKCAAFGPGTPSLPGKRSEDASGAQRRSSGCAHAETDESQPVASRQTMRSMRPARTEAGATEASASRRETASCAVASNRSEEVLGWGRR